MALLKIFLIPLGVMLTAWPLMWTVLRILRPIDQAAQERNLPFRFSMGDFLCLFWVVQPPLAFVYHYGEREAESFYWTLTVMVWGVAPFVWYTCARALSKAGVSAGKHRFIFLGVVVPAVYYGLFPFIWLSWAGLGTIGFKGIDSLLRYGMEISLWLVLLASLLVSGFYSPWLVQNAVTPLAPENDAPEW